MNNLDTILKLSGIYQIKNQKNNKVYIGSSINCNFRCKTHYKQLVKNTHINKKLQNAWNKYGPNAFKFEIIELVEDKNNLIIQEQSFLDKLKPEYNICKIAGNTLGFKFSEESLKMRTIRLFDKNSGVKSPLYKGGHIKPKNKLELKTTYHNEKNNIPSKTRQAEKTGKEVNQYDNNMNLLETWSSIKSASDTLNIPRQSIKKCCEGKSRHAGFFIWRLKGKENIEYGFRIKPIIQLNDKNEVIGEYNQIVIAAEKLKINRRYISKALKTGKTYCGFYWKYKTEQSCHTHIEK